MEKVTKQVLTINDLMTMLDVKYDTACEKMKEIKAVSDIWQIKGVVGIDDYECYIESRKGNKERR